MNWPPRALPHRPWRRHRNPGRRCRCAHYRVSGPSQGGPRSGAEGPRARETVAPPTAACAALAARDEELPLLQRRPPNNVSLAAEHGDQDEDDEEEARPSSAPAGLSRRKDHLISRASLRSPNVAGGRSGLGRSAPLQTGSGLPAITIPTEWDVAKSIKEKLVLRAAIFHSVRDRGDSRKGVVCGRRIRRGAEIGVTGHCQGGSAACDHQYGEIYVVAPRPPLFDDGGRPQGLCRGVPSVQDQCWQEEHDSRLFPIGEEGWKLLRSIRWGPFDCDESAARLDFCEGMCENSSLD